MKNCSSEEKLRQSFVYTIYVQFVVVVLIIGLSLLFFFFPSSERNKMCFLISIN